MMESKIEFKFIEFNPRRAMRGADAARVEVTEATGESEWMWMSKRDLSKNIKLFGEHPELLKAKSAYAAFP